MNQEIAKTLAGGSAKLASGTGISTVILAWFGSNAAGIGAICTIITCVAYIYFGYTAAGRNNEKDRQAEENKTEIDKLKKQLRESK